MRQPFCKRRLCKRSIVAGGGEHGIDRVACGVCEAVSAHAMAGFHVAGDGLDRGPALEFALHRLGDAALLARDIDLEAMFGRRVVAAIAAIGGGALDRGAGPLLHLRDHDCEGMAVIGFPGEAFTCKSLDLT